MAFSVSIFQHRTACVNSPRPLQIRLFTGHAYNAIKRREEVKSKRCRNSPGSQSKKANSTGRSLILADNSSPTRFESPVEDALQPPPHEVDLTLNTSSTVQDKEESENPVFVEFGQHLGAHADFEDFAHNIDLLDSIVEKPIDETCFDAAPIAQSESLLKFGTAPTAPYFVDRPNQCTGEGMFTSTEFLDSTSLATPTPSLSKCTSSIVADSKPCSAVFSEVRNQSLQFFGSYSECQFDSTESDARSNTKGLLDSSRTRDKWNTAQDERLLHLVDVAQLDWPILVAHYFPHLSPNSLKQRYHVLQVQRRKIQVIRKNKSSIDPCLKVTKNAVRVTSAKVNCLERVTLNALARSEDIGPRTRSGRRVMKPLRYWAGESYIWSRGEMEGVLLASSTV